MPDPMETYIPKKKNIKSPNREDPMFWYYFPIIGNVYKKRLTNTLSLLGGNYGQLLDIGYGSGIMFPELSLKSQKVFGLEVHGKEELVGQMLQKEEINNVVLKKGSIYNIPFEDNYFDCIISISVLEHLYDLDKAMSEIKRVLKKRGEVIFSFPIRNLFTDLFFRIAGHDPRYIHPSSHADILDKAKKHFSVDKILKFPNLPDAISLYYSIKCTKN
jgi:ubiquinone/menaquinone biosynthesis C-methylase UbiE